MEENFIRRVYWLITSIITGDWCIEMHNGDSRAELSYIDEKRK
jgi:hypothetical protein